MTDPINRPPLSPAAQAVLTTYEKAWGQGYGSPLAAALRAAADQVVPENYECFTGYVEWDQGSEARNDTIRENILAIAAELENNS